MPSIGPFFFILGLVVASVTANDTSTHSSVSIEFQKQSLGSNNSASTNVTPSTTNYNTYNTDTSMTRISSTTSTMNITKANSTMTPSTTKHNDDKDPKNKPSQRTMFTPFQVTPKPINPNSVPATKTKVDKGPTTTPKNAVQTQNNNIGIIILIVIILLAVGFGLACLFTWKRGRRYSADFSSRPDEAHIPLSTMTPELPADTVAQNGLQTFPETPTNEPQEQEAKPEVQEDQKAEADVSVVEPSAESAAPVPSPDSPVDKPKEDIVEQSPPAPVEPSVEEKTDDEGVVSNKTSVESLKETNENNSNNADLSQKRDLKSSNLFWDVPLHCPV